MGIVLLFVEERGVRSAMNSIELYLSAGYITKGSRCPEKDVEYFMEFIYS